LLGACSFAWDKLIQNYKLQYLEQRVSKKCTQTSSDTFMFCKEPKCNSLMARYALLLEPMIKIIRLEHYSYQTEQFYTLWVAQFYIFIKASVLMILTTIIFYLF
jgi:hypothetical protein